MKRATKAAGAVVDGIIDLIDHPFGKAGETEHLKGVLLRSATEYYRRLRREGVDPLSGKSA
jgi:hypothetical protein